MQYVYLASSFTEMLQEILSAIFNEVLSPVLRSVFNALVALLGDYLWEIFCDILLDGLIVLLKLVAFLEQMFNLFSGLAYISVHSADGQTTKTSLLNYVFQLNGLGKAFAVISVIAAGCAFFFAIYSTGKAMADLPFEDKQAPISAVLKNGLKSALMFLLIPMMSLFLLNMSGAVLTQVIMVFQTADTYADQSMDDILFMTAAQDAEKSADAGSMYEGHQYQNRDKVKDKFNIADINYVLGYVSSILLILILLNASISFVQRLFELLILYLVSPFFAATIAMDGGSRFKYWRELFIAKFFAGFGSIFAIRLYLMVSPVFMSGDLVFSADTAVDGCIKLFLVIGGAFAVFKGQNTFLQILNPEAASTAATPATAIASFALGRVRGAVGGIGGKIRSGRGGK